MNKFAIKICFLALFIIGCAGKKEKKVEKIPQYKNYLIVDIYIEKFGDRAAEDRLALGEMGIHVGKYLSDLSVGYLEHFGDVSMIGTEEKEVLSRTRSEAMNVDVWKFRLGNRVRLRETEEMNGTRRYCYVIEVGSGVDILTEGYKEIDKEAHDILKLDTEEGRKKLFEYLEKFSKDLEEK